MKWTRWTITSATLTGEEEEEDAWEGKKLRRVVQRRLSGDEEEDYDWQVI